LALRDNQRFGFYEEDKLAELVYPEIQHLDLTAFKVDLGEALDLKQVVERFGPDIEDGADEVPEVDDTPAITKPGDLFTLGKHRLLCGDSTKADDVARLMRGEKADLVFTSPPYNCDIAYNEYPDKKSKEDYLSFIRRVMETCYGAMDNGRFIGWNIGVSPKTFCHLQGAMLEDVGFAFWRQICWKKTGVSYPVFVNTEKHPTAGNYRPNFQHEVIFLFTKGRAEFRGTIIPDSAYSNDVWDIHQSQATHDIPGETGGKHARTTEHGSHKSAAHPAAYPVRIPAGAIKHLSTDGEIVLDPFVGAGGTLIASQELGRVCYGMEIDPKYCDVIIKRYADFTGTSEESIRATVEHGE
jgi:DNA modification methylase